MLKYGTKILIVARDKRIQMLLKSNLEMEGCMVDQAYDGKSSLLKVRHLDYSLVVLDAAIPYQNGITLCSKIKKDNEVPVIVVTDNDHQMLESFQAGADDCVLKPFSSTELVLRIRAIIKRYTAWRSDGLIIRDRELIKLSHLIIERSAHRILVDHIPVHFSLKEYELLLYMANNPNVVLTKEHLFHVVWKHEQPRNYRTIDTHIKRIRDKLSKASTVSRNMIQTIWGIGYILRDPV
ncbi:response regulator transcription factor [Paenibacillus sp. FJAT-27812]|uniref:response regulator transcription factor n=1 Tax=Paenibacillus sp. FJAT-27812 TaxID=1684143 RepID=UPI0006A794F4|nr:response regulator transcription factor [Paenibacillus sp. FJAT-27812]